MHTEFWSGNLNCLNGMKRQLVRPRRRWGNKVDNKEIECKGVDWINLAQDGRTDGRTNSCEHDCCRVIS